MLCVTMPRVPVRAHAKRPEGHAPLLPSLGEERGQQWSSFTVEILRDKELGGG